MIIWLASYPKSGNTWVRAIISSLLFSEDGNFNFSLIKNIKQYPIKEQFKEFITNFEDLNEIKKHWVLTQEKINLDNQIKFLKTHHLNCKIGEYSFTNKDNTLATIYIVRDPRNLVSSISNHFDYSLEESKNFILSQKFIGGNKVLGDLNKNYLPTILGSWKEHYRFWKNKNENYLLIKYEDLINQPKIELEKIISFLKRYIPIKTNEEKNKKILYTTSFENLKNLEIKGNFNENAYQAPGKKITFFHLGPKNNWKKLLDNKITKELELKLENEMKELGYL